MIRAIIKSFLMFWYDDKNYYQKRTLQVKTKKKKKKNQPYVIKISRSFYIAWTDFGQYNSITELFKEF